MAVCTHVYMTVLKKIVFSFYRYSEDEIKELKRYIQVHTDINLKVNCKYVS